MGTPQQRLNAASTASTRRTTCTRGKTRKERRSLLLKAAELPYHGGYANRLAPPSQQWLFLTSGRWCCAAFCCPNAPTAHSMGSGVCLPSRDQEPAGNAACHRHTSALPPAPNVCSYLS